MLLQYVLGLKKCGGNQKNTSKLFISSSPILCFPWIVWAKLYLVSLTIKAIEPKYF